MATEQCTVDRFLGLLETIDAVGRMTVDTLITMRQEHQASIALLRKDNQEIIQLLREISAKLD